MSDQELIRLLPQARDFLNSRFGPAPQVAVVLGSGLSNFSSELADAQAINSPELPGAVTSTVAGHHGKILCGKIGVTPVAIVAGRVHGFEGHSPTQVVHNLRALRMWGVQQFILTNAAGSTSRAYKPGNLVLIKDHINLTGKNPLIGLELFGGERFPDVSDIYSKKWRALALKTAKKLKLPLKEGVYIKVNGPSYETAAEIKMFAKWGAHLVGMSTVWESLALKQMGAEILGISCVTNFGTGVTSASLSHEEVIETTKRVQAQFSRFLKALIQAG